ncbi:hypothetical protein [Pedobacter sp. V48]|uniref:hypothetical protein n=1 Tax=Pedobacter sp. V48 TaxID=509635 RepID=UPI0004B4C693|nr:hypothetical protein [Pedobacter sp. V48]
MMKIKSVNYKELLLHWVVGLFMFLNLFALSGIAKVISPVNLAAYPTEQRIVNQSGTNGHKIFYKSFVAKINWIYSKISSLKYVFRNLLMLKNSIVHIQFNANAFLVLSIDFLLGTLCAVRFLFYPASPKTSLPA